MTPPNSQCANSVQAIRDVRHPSTTFGKKIILVNDIYINNMAHVYSVLIILFGTIPS